jgi:hypothetical protein
MSGETFLQILRQLNDIADRVKSVEISEQLVDLREQLLGERRRAVALQDENDRLAEEVGLLRAQLKRQVDLVEVHGRFYERGLDGRPKGLPYCEPCRQKGLGLFRFERVPEPNRPVACPNCGLRSIGVKGMG